MRRRGFTLVELAFVLGVLAILVAISVPSYHSIVLRARVAEARAILPAIAHAELMHRRDHGAYLECPAGAEVVPAGVPAPFPERACWKALGVAIDGLVRYRYQARLTDSGFEVVAEGDLDGDGQVSTLTLTSRDLSISAIDEFD